MTALYRAYQNMTDAQAMSYSPPGEDPPWDDAGEGEGTSEPDGEPDTGEKE